MKNFRNSVFDWGAIIHIKCDCNKHFPIYLDRKQDIYKIDGQIYLCPNCNRENIIKTAGMPIINFNNNLREYRKRGRLPHGLIFNKTNYNSYCDSTLRFVNISLNQNILDVNDAQIKKLKRVEYADKLAEILPIYIRNNYRESLLHEYFHSLQSVFYPFLYLQSWLEQRVYSKFGYYLNHLDENLNYKNLALPTDYANTMSFQYVYVKMVIDKDKLLCFDTPVSDSDPNNVSINDLCENAASIFEYKYVAGDNHSAKEFVKWVKLNLRYQNVFNLLSQIFGEEDCYKFLPVIIKAAFHTTFPVGAFGSIVNHLSSNKNLLSVYNSLELLDYILTMMSSQEALKGKIIPEPPLHNIPKVFITNEMYKEIIVNTEFHTCHLMAKKYMDAFEQDKDIDDLFFNSEKENNIRVLLNRIPPPVTIINFPEPHFKNYDRSIFIDDAYAYEMYSILDISYGKMMVENIRQKEFFYNLLYNLNDNQIKHRCPHNKCKIHKTDLCRNWAPPENKNDCGFRNWIISNYNKRIDWKHSELITI